VCECVSMFTCNSKTGKKVKVKKGIAVRELHLTATGIHIPYGITQCYPPPGRGNFPPLPQPKLVLELATLKRCKAEYVVVVTSQDS